MARAQISIEFFLIAGFILVAASVLISNSDQQIQDTSSLNNVVAARNAMDLETSIARYVFYSGNWSTVTHITFIPANTTCFNYNDTVRKLYCVTSGVTGLVYSDPVAFELRNATGHECGRSGWLRVRTRNENGFVYFNCTRL